MLHFSYKGRNANNKELDGFIDSETKESAISLLQQNGITVVSIDITEDESQVKKFLNRYGFHFNMPSLEDLILFSRQMYSLTKAGVPIVRAIRVVAESVNNEKLALALEDIVTKLESGQSLATCMEKHNLIFPTLMHALINVGENTGSLDEVFKQVGMHLGRENETKKKIKTAMRYPMMVVIAIGVAIGIINIFVVPAFANFFSSFGADLPLPTKILIASSHFMVNYWYVVILFIFGVIISCITFLRTDYGAMVWDRWKLKLPIIGSIIERALLARFARSFALTSRSGVPLLDAIAIIAQTTDNVFVGQRIMSMRSSIEHGESLATSATNTKMFSPLVLQMVAIGEETGDVDRLLDEIADFYEEELDYDLKTLSEAIEPILIGIVAVMVLILALGVFLPMWDISKVALGK